MSKIEITAVGIDVSKGKSTVAVRRPGGEIVMMPFTVLHTAEGLAELTNTLRSIGGEIRVVMEHTGMYWRPIALALKEGGFFVSVVNAMLIHDFSDNSIRKVKTDRADSLKIANLQIGVKPPNEKNYTSHIAPKSRHDKQTCKGSRFADLGFRSAAALRRLTSSDHAVLRHGCCRQPYIKADRYATQPVCESIVFRYSFTFA